MPNSELLGVKRTWTALKEPYLSRSKWCFKATTWQSILKTTYTTKITMERTASYWLLRIHTISMSWVSQSTKGTTVSTIRQQWHLHSLHLKVSWNPCLSRWKSLPQFCKQSSSHSCRSKDWIFSFWSASLLATDWSTPWWSISGGVTRWTKQFTSKCLALLLVSACCSSTLRGSLCSTCGTRVWAI